MAISSFTAKQLRVTFTLSDTTASFNGNNNVLVLAGLRTVARINASGFPAFPEATLEVYGMAVSDMQVLSSLSRNLNGTQPDNVRIDANSGAGWSTVYEGQIVSAYIDYSGAPDVCFRVQSRYLGFQSINPAQVTSYRANADCALVISDIVAKMGQTFVNHGVNITLPKPYFAGTLTDQLKAAVEAAGISMYFNEATHTIHIAPQGTALKDDPFVITPQSGLVGYPVPDSRGFINARTLFHSVLRLGSPVTIQGSDVVIDAKQPSTYNSRADGQWFVSAITHTLEAVKYGGAWFSDMLLVPNTALLGAK